MNVGLLLVCVLIIRFRVLGLTVIVKIHLTTIDHAVRG